MGPYYTSSEDFRLHFSDCSIFELQLVQLLVISPIQANSDNVSQRLYLSKALLIISTQSKRPTISQIHDSMTDMPVPISRACLSAATTLAEALAKPPKLWALGIGAVHGGCGWICQLIWMYLNFNETWLCEIIIIIMWHIHMYMYTVCIVSSRISAS